MIKEINFIQDNTPPLIRTIVINWVLTNKFIFPFSEVIYDLKENKKVFETKLKKYENNLNSINTNNLIINREKYIALKRIDFFKQIYDIEANKLDKNQDFWNLPDYDKYSKIFFWATSKDIEKISYLPKKNKKLNKIISKKQMIHFLNKTREFIPNLQISFDNYPNFVVSVKKWVLVPDKYEYNLQEIITLFFHEMSHYIRGLNMKRNLWFVTQLSDNWELEEGFALYNEYFYWNQIIDYGTYYPYYHKIYNYLMDENLSFEEKKQKVEEILSYKWFSKEKSYNFFQRFYRFAPLGWEKMLLKDSIYYNSYKKVNQLLKEWYDLNLLMSIKWGLQSIEYLMDWKKLNNFEFRKYFEVMVKEVRKII